LRPNVVLPACSEMPNLATGPVVALARQRQQQALA